MEVCNINIKSFKDSLKKFKVREVDTIAITEDPEAKEFQVGNYTFRFTTTIVNFGFVGAHSSGNEGWGKDPEAKEYVEEFKTRK